MSKPKLHFDVLNSADDSLKLNIVLENSTDTELKDFVLCFDMPRFIDKQTVVNGHVTSQVGSHIEMTPPANTAIGKGERWLTTIESQTCGLFNLSERPNHPYLRLGETIVDVERGTHKMSQPEDLDLRVLTLPAASSGVIPQPQSIEPAEGEFRLANQVTFNAEWPETRNAIDWLSNQFPEVAFAKAEGDATLSLLKVSAEHIMPEGYELTIGGESIQIKAATSAGFFYGVVTLAQLLVTGQGVVASATIIDAPQYHHRGQFLDCARSFHGIDTVKSVIDQMAWLKLDTFHWHLTDDEAWRIEIDAFPELTDLGAWRGEGELQPSQFGSGPKRYGGFFTKQQIKEVVEYAKAREIAVIPEIDIPGHARALIMALPHLLREADDKSEYVSIQQYQDNVLNPGLPGTYQVLETILDEVCELFPSQVIHLGGDEVPKRVWEKSPACIAKAKAMGLDDVRLLEGHLISHLEQYLAQKGRKIAVWEEASHGNKITSNATVCAWSNGAEGQKAAAAGYPVIMCPAQATYLDMAWNKDVNETGVLWAGAIDLKTAYEFDPGSIDNSEQVIGTQALVWTEFVKDKATLEYLLYPRLFAVAEVAWTASENKSWQSFLPRVAAQLEYLDMRNINYRRMSS
ncbi:beta-hexosaminidase [Vibrio maritimus]|uniref:beta-N-acetylhexosaminidase n=1 Tax=Vibrio maritimus TaxID=990268 RepID=A0A090SUW9_9VIBR|nr:beta-hexosaminidase [Vibrio maritimus]